MHQDRLNIELKRVAERYRHLFYWQVLAAVWLAAAAGVAAYGGLNLNLRRMSPVVLMSMAGGLAAIAAAIWRCGISAPNHLVLAKRIEKQFPDLNSGLCVAVEQIPTLPDGRYGFLQQAVIDQVVAHAETHPWWKVVSRRRMALAVVAQYTTFGLFLASLLVSLPSARSPVVAKQPKRPAGSTSGEFAVSIEPGDVELERGSSLLVLARVQGALPAESTLVYGSASGDATRLAMSASLDDPIFGGRIAAVTQPLQYHVELGGHVTPTFRVTVFEYPCLDRADARLIYPSYTGLEERLIQDIRTLSVVEGTEVTLICQLNKPVKTARFVEKVATTQGEKSVATGAKGAGGAAQTVADPVLADLPLALLDGNVYEAKFTAARSRRLKLELIDDAGRKNTEESLIVVQVVPNQPPTFKLAFPVRDMEVSPLEELDVKATAWDDYGLQRMGVTYTLAGKPATDVVLGTNAAARHRHPLASVIRFEDLHAEPDQLLAYHFWAEDIGPDGQVRRTSSDMYFAEVRHFDEIFRQGETLPGGQQQPPQQGNQNTEAAQKLAQLQKDIITATWNLIRRETASQPSAAFAEDVKQVRESQGSALNQATELGENVRDVESQAHLLSLLEAMQQAVTHLDAARDKSTLAELPLALAAEQSAYQGLLKLRAREHEVVRQQQSSSASRSSQSQRSEQQRQQMQQLDLQNEENRYETQRLAQSQEQNPEDRETKQVLNRLRELARRQHDLNERLKDLQSALQEAASDEKKEEIRQQLKRLQDEQREMLRDTDELQSRMETPENMESMAEERQQLEQARNQVQRASESLEGEQVTQAAASGTRAEKEFEDLRNEFRKRASGQLNEQMRDLRNDARELDQDEQELAEQLGAVAEPAPDKKTLRDDDRGQSNTTLADRLNQQKDRLANLSERLQNTVQEAEQTEPLLTEKLADAARNLQGQNIERALEVAGRSARQGLLKDAREVEKIAGRGISQFREGIEKAAESVLGDETEALRRAREQLRDLARELNQEIARNTPGEQIPTVPGREATGDTEPQRKEKQAGADGQLPEESRSPMPDAKGESRPGSTGESRAQTEPRPQGSDPASERPDGERQPIPRQSASQDLPRPTAKKPRQPMPRESPAGQPGGAVPDREQPENGSEGAGGSVRQREGSGQPSGPEPESQRGPTGRPMPSSGAGQLPGQDPQRSQRGGPPGPNRAGLGAGGGPAEGTMEEGMAPISGDDFLNWSDRLRDVEEMVDDPELRAEAARIRDQARSIRAELKRHARTPNWKLVRANVAEPLAELTNRVAEELLRRNARQAIVPLDRDPVPPKYSEKTRRYYERLGSGK